MEHRIILDIAENSFLNVTIIITVAIIAIRYAFAMIDQGV